MERQSNLLCSYLLYSKSLLSESYRLNKNATNRRCVKIEHSNTSKYMWWFPEQKNTKRKNRNTSLIQTFIYVFFNNNKGVLNLLIKVNKLDQLEDFVETFSFNCNRVDKLCHWSIKRWMMLKGQPVEWLSEGSYCWPVPVLFPVCHPMAENY